MRANERTDERVGQYLRLYSCLFQTTVRSRLRARKREIPNGMQFKLANAIFFGSMAVNELIHIHQRARANVSASALWDKTRSFWDIKNSLSHERGSERNWASKRTSERSEGREQANERTVRANEQTDERVALYCSLVFWLFWPTERRESSPPWAHWFPAESLLVLLPFPLVYFMTRSKSIAHEYLLDDRKVE